MTCGGGFLAPSLLSGLDHGAGSMDGDQKKTALKLSSWFNIFGVYLAFRKNCSSVFDPKFLREPCYRLGMVDCLNALPTDYVCFGNHEYFYHVAICVQVECEFN